IDRANLKRILDENKLTISGLIDPDNAKKLGKISGVDAFVLGSVTVLKNDVQLTAKIIDTDTAEILGAGKARVSKDDEMTQLLGRGVDTTTAGFAENQKPMATTFPRSDFSA